MGNEPHLRPVNAKPLEDEYVTGTAKDALKQIVFGAVMYWTGNGNNEAVIRPYGEPERHTKCSGHAAKLLVDIRFVAATDDPSDSTDDGLPYYVTPRGLAFAHRVMGIR